MKRVEGGAENENKDEVRTVGGKRLSLAWGFVGGGDGHPGATLKENFNAWASFSTRSLTYSFKEVVCQTPKQGNPELAFYGRLHSWAVLGG